jgi:hypothetical protein
MARVWMPYTALPPTASTYRCKTTSGEEQTEGLSFACAVAQVEIRASQIETWNLCNLNEIISRCLSLQQQAYEQDARASIGQMRSWTIENRLELN